MSCLRWRRKEEKMINVYSILEFLFIFIILCYVYIEHFLHISMYNHSIICVTLYITSIF